jgi:polar amino acid transport system substrate-binding protein
LNVPGAVNAGVLLVCVAGLACQPSANSTLERIREAGFVRIGYATEAPYAYEAGGHVTGEAPEIARVAFRRLGVDSVVWIRREFAALIGDLQRGRFDVIAAGMFITPEREIAFTVPTFCVGPALLVRRGNPRGLDGYAAVRADTGARLAVVEGAVEQRIALAAGIPERRLVVVPDQRTALAAVELGRADALALSALTVNRLARAARGTVEQVPMRDDADGRTPPAGGCGSLGLRREDGELRDALNGALRAFVGTADHRRLVARFGFTAAELPPWAAGAPDRGDAGH